MSSLPLSLSDGGLRPGGSMPGSISAGNVVLDEGACVAFIGARRIALGAGQARLLGYFMRRANTVVTREALAAALWSGKQIDPRSIDVAIVRLRQALHEGQIGRVIRTVHSEGYEFVGVPERSDAHDVVDNGGTGRREVKA